MYGILLVIHGLIAIVLIGLILIQHGKGAQTGAAFGSGASQTVFGSQGSGGFLSRATATLAALFFIINLLLVYIVTKNTHHPEVMSMPTDVKAPAEEKGSSPEPEGKKGSSDVPEVD